MPLSLLQIVLIILGAGAIGGAVNAYLVDGGFKKSVTMALSDGQQIRKPGWLGNVFVGSVAAFVVWALYGAMEIADGQLLLRQIAGAVLTGGAGGRIITSEIDKRFLHATKDALAEALREEETGDK